MKKLTGSDIINIIKTSSKNEEVNREAQALVPQDFNEEDLVVKTFLNMFPNGFASASFQKTDKIKVASTLSSIKKEIVDTGLRKAFILLQNVRNASNEAVTLENDFNEYTPTKGVQNQIKAAQLVEFLSKYVDGQINKNILSQASEEINNGDLDQASDNIRRVFSGDNQNIRKAFVTIKQQIGEPYLLCPKGIYNLGYAVPMATSSCRDYCIDAKNHPDGTVSCNYLKWLKEGMISHEQTKHLFDTIVTEHETMNLEPGQRSKFPMSQQDSQDMRINRGVETINEPFELQFEEWRAKNKPESKPKPKPLATDAAMEILLKEYREVFDEDELDVLEQQLREAMGDETEE